MNTSQKIYGASKPRKWQKRAIEYLLFWEDFSQKRIAMELRINKVTVNRILRKEGWQKKSIASKYEYRQGNKLKVKNDTISFLMYLKIKQPELYNAVTISYEEMSGAIDFVLHSKTKQPTLYEPLTTAIQQYLKTF